MQTVDLKAVARTQVGKSAVRKLRQAGSVPGVVYGPKREPIAVAFDAREFRKSVGLHEGNPLIRIASDESGIGGCVVLLRDAQYDALSGDIVHADFYEVDMAKKIRVPVPLTFSGKPAGVVRGGILQPVRRDVEVECLPGSIPESIDVDVSALDIHDSVHVSQLVLPDGVEVPFDVDFTLVTVAPPTVAEAAEEAAEEEPSVPEVESTGSAEEESDG